MMDTFILNGNPEGGTAPRLRTVLQMYIPENIDVKAAEFLLETDRALAKSDIVQAARAMDMAMKELVSEFRRQKETQTGHHASLGFEPTN